jgi:hypothetical protein
MGSVAADRMQWRTRQKGGSRGDIGEIQERIRGDVGEM